jgi:spore germination protein GerM
MFKTLRAFLLPVLAVLAVGLALFFFLSENREAIKKEPVETGTEAGESQGAAEGAPKRTVTLLFLSEESESLVPEEREIFAAPESPEAEARAVLNELVKGSEKGLLSALPPETRLIQVYIERDGTAYVDFSKEFADRHPSGSTAEIQTVYAVVDTLAQNIKTVKKVFLLVDGEERETLAGHIAIDRPIAPDYSLIAGRS